MPNYANKHFYRMVKALFLIIFASQMRVVAEIPHPRFKISIFHWNAKYLLTVELDAYEQVYKIADDAVSGLEQVKKMVTPEFLEACLQQFLGMRSAFTNSYKQTQ